MDAILGRKRIMLKKSLTAGIGIIMIVTGGVVDGVDLAAGQSRNISSDADEGTTYTMSRGKLVLDSKEKNYVLVCQRRFEVTSSTVIKNEFGMESTFEDLTVPCEAMVHYYKNPGEKNAYKAVSIEVQGRPRPQPE
jgi:hypothetical protein